MKNKLLAEKLRNCRLWMFHLIPLLVIIVIFPCCNEKQRGENWRHVEIHPKDNSQTITIITEENKRYIMDGKHDKVPDDGYLLLDISQVDQLGDGVSVCWNESGHKWKIASSYALLVENKLDTSKFLYYQPKGKNGEPTSDGYLGSECGGILIRVDLKTRGDIAVTYITQ